MDERFPKMSLISLSLLVFSILILFECSPKEVSCYSVPHTSPNHHNRHSHSHHHHHSHQSDHHSDRGGHQQKPRAGRSSSRFAQLDRILDRLDSDSFNDNALDDLSTRATIVANDSTSVTTESWLIQPVDRVVQPVDRVVQPVSRNPTASQRNPPIPRVNLEDNIDEDDDDDDDDDYGDYEDVVDGDFDKGGSTAAGRRQPENAGWSEDTNVAMLAQADTEINQRSPYSEAKWRTMGSRSGVDMLFNNYRRGIQNSITDSRSVETQEAMQHNMRMSREGACKVPRAKVVRVADLYPSANKQYLPACTILHQCTEDAGCCVGRKRCGAKTTKRTVLYFNTVTFYYQGRTRRQESSVEKLTFYNHTECECQEASNEEMPRDATYQRISQLRAANVAEKICRCPSEYTVRHLANGSCTCDCFDKQRDCIKYKKGIEYFSHNDRLCIEMETCLQPACDFGVYMRRSGRCPKRTEKFRSWQRYT